MQALGKSEIVVGQDEEDLHATGETLLGIASDAPSAFELVARGKEGSAIGESETEVLRVGELEPIGAELLRQSHDFGDSPEVLAIARRR